MCISLNKANRIRLIVSSTDISEEAELRLTSMLNETIKNYWVALGMGMLNCKFGMKCITMKNILTRTLPCIF